MASTSTKKNPEPALFDQTEKPHPSVLPGNTLNASSGRSWNLMKRTLESDGGITVSTEATVKGPALGPDLGDTGHWLSISVYSEQFRTIQILQSWKTTDLMMNTSGSPNLHAGFYVRIAYPQPHTTYTILWTYIIDTNSITWIATQLW